MTLDMEGRFFVASSSRMTYIRRKEYGRMETGNHKSLILVQYSRINLEFIETIDLRTRKAD
jgi:hypothetical protein